MKAKKEFKVIIERDEDGFFVASVPALPGCHTQAKTMQGLAEKTKDAIRLCLEVALIDKKYQARIKSFAYNPSFVGLEVMTV